MHRTILSSALPASASGADDTPEPPGRLPAPVRTPAGLVGNTPVLCIGAPLTPPGRSFWAKLEGANPGGIKDRAALHMVARARARGVLAPGARIVESTSGTLGLGLALAGLTHGHPVTLVTDPGMEPPLLGQLRAYGADVQVVDRPHDHGGWQRARCERVAELLAAEADAWCPDQYGNPDSVDAYTALGLELAAQLGRVDVLVAAVGTGGHSAGTARTLRSLRPGLRLVGVDSVRSTIFGQPAGPRLMRGLGSSIHPGNVDHDAFDEVHWVAPAEAVWACRALARHHRTGGGWSVGAVALVAGRLAGELPPRTRIAAVFPDGMHRYCGTVFDDAWCAARGLTAAAPPEPPLTLHDPGSEIAERWTRWTRRPVPEAAA